MRSALSVVIVAACVAGCLVGCGEQKPAAPARDPALPPGLVLPSGKAKLASKQVDGDVTTLVYEYARAPAELLGELVSNLHAEGHQGARLDNDAVTASLGFAKKTITATAREDGGTTKMTLVITPDRPRDPAIEPAPDASLPTK